MNELLKSALPIALIVSVPSLMALIGIVFNRMDANRLDGRITNLDAKVDQRITALGDKVDRLNAALGDKIDRLKDTVHSNVQQLLRLDADKDARIARLEPRA